MLLVGCGGDPIDLGFSVEDSAVTGEGDAAEVSGVGEGAVDLEPDPLADLDLDPVPAGYPATADTTPSWCELGSPQQERCGTGMDEDCDGRVDENPLLGEPCYSLCDSAGQWLCDRKQQQLVCIDFSCLTIPSTCNNEQRDAGEQCDVSAGDPGHADVGPLEVYCREDCRWDTRFEDPCWRLVDGQREPILIQGFAGLSSPCEAAGLVCSDRVRSCVPKLGEERWKRCPRLRRLETAQEYALRLEADNLEPPVYAMIQSEEGECHISCSTDAECPEALGTCYMGACVIW